MVTLLAALTKEPWLVGPAVFLSAAWVLLLVVLLRRLRRRGVLIRFLLGAAGLVFLSALILRWQPLPARSYQNPRVDVAKLGKAHRRRHSPGWPQRHSEEAKKTPSACLTCHRRSFCDECHGMAVPHPENWLKRHAVAAAKNGRQICIRCHISQDCDACHRGHKHNAIK